MNLCSSKMSLKYLQAFVRICITTILLALGASADECAEQLLLLDYHKGIEKLCATSNDSKILAASSEGDRLQRFSYSPRDGGSIVAFNNSKLMTFEHINSGNGSVMPNRVVDFPSRMCQELEFNTPFDLAIDWTTDIVYITYLCGKIVAYDLKRSLYATVCEDKLRNPSFIVTYPQKGLLLWRDGDFVCRVFTDGTAIKCLVTSKRYSSVPTGHIAVDYETSFVYWTNDKYKEIFRCDLDGNYRERLELSMHHKPSRIAVLGNIVHWLEVNDDMAVLYRADTEKATQKIIQNYTALGDLIALPPTNLFKETTHHPCSNSSCAYICVQSSQKGYACICSDDNVLQRDGHNCEGIFQVPIVNGIPSAERTLLPLNVSGTLHIQCDNAEGRLYWAQEHEGSTSVMRVDMNNLEKNPEVVFKRDHLNIRYPTEELQAFALNYVSTVFGMVFRGQRRILICSYKNNVTTTENKCTELYGNNVAASVGGLALFDWGLCWTENDEDSLAIMVGSMDGRQSERKTLRKRGLKHPTSIAVSLKQRWFYWVDSLTHRIEHTNFRCPRYRPLFESSKYGGFVLQVIVAYEEQLYGAGTSADFNSEAIFSTTMWRKPNYWNVTHYSAGNVTSSVSSLSVYDKKEVQKRNNRCTDGDSCVGICFSFGYRSLCTCTSGLEHDPLDGNSCKEPAKPVIIYGAAQGTTVMANGSIARRVTTGEGGAVAFDPLRSVIFTFGDFACWREKDRNEDTCLTEYSGAYRATAFHVPASEMTFFKANYTLTGFHIKDVQLSSMEYDWIGENFYFAGGGNVIVLCSMNRLYCTDVYTAEPFYQIRKVALDPLSRRMYWIEDLLPNNASDMHITGISSGSMSGSGAEPMFYGDQFFRRIVTDLHVDQTSRLLFWVDRVEIFVDEHAWEILRSDLRGGNVKTIIALSKKPIRIRTAGNRLFWMPADDRSVISCDKETADGLVAHDLRDLDTDVRDFLVIAPNSSVKESERDPCTTGALCSHICVPTAAYMTCLCPRGYKLQSDNLTCECEDPAKCSSPEGNEGTGRRPQSDFSSRIMQRSPCPGNPISCNEECIDIEHVCDGIPDCADYSDEGQRCNEVCVDNNGCSHACKQTPNGPACFCPPEQVLAEDNKNCTIRMQTEAGKAGLIVSGVLGLLLVIVIVVSTIKYRHSKRELQNLTDHAIKEFLRGDPEGAKTAPDGLDRALMVPYTHVVSPNDIIRATETVLGSGEFGIVHPGIYKSEPVAIKSLKRSVDVDEFKAVLAELKIMAYMGGHEFIVMFLGAEISDIAQRKLMIVTELSPHGDLLHYLWKVGKAGLKTGPAMYDNVTEDHTQVTDFILCKWCEQIATGMEYLDQKQIVHGDLAARNVLVFKNHVVKISDFGLSKQLYGNSQYQAKKQCKLPWKWAAIELLTSTEFSKESDVWAFGVTAWEIFSLGQTPYKGMVYSHEFIQYLQAGNRLAKPEHASDEIYNMLLECWNGERSARPGFGRLKQYFRDLSIEEMRAIGPALRCLEDDAESYYTTAV